MALFFSNMRLYYVCVNDAQGTTQKSRSWSCPPLTQHRARSKWGLLIKSKRPASESGFQIKTLPPPGRNVICSYTKEVERSLLVSLLSLTKTPLDRKGVRRSECRAQPEVLTCKRFAVLRRNLQPKEQFIPIIYVPILRINNAAVRGCENIALVAPGAQIFRYLQLVICP